MILLIFCLFSISIELTVHKLPTTPNLKAKALLNLYPLIDASNQFSSIAQQLKNSEPSISLDILNITNTQQEEIKNKIGKYVQTDYSNLENGIFTGVLFNIFVPCNSKNMLKETIEQIDSIKNMIRENDKLFLYATSEYHIHQAFYERKIAVLIGIDGGHMIQNSISILRSFYSLGVRKLTLTRRCSNKISEIQTENENTPKSGLTTFGRKVIDEMNKFNMIVDLGHITQESMKNVMNESNPLAQKIMISHSNVYSICQHPNNLKDEVIDSIGKRKGLILISFESFHSSNEEWNQLKFLMDQKNTTNEKDVIFEFNDWKSKNPFLRTNISKVVDHIDYIKNRIGVDFVGFGSDFDGVLSLPYEMENCSDMIKIIEELIKRGYSNEDVKKIVSDTIMKSDEKSQSSTSTISSFYKNRFLQSFMKFHEVFHHLNGELLFHNFFGYFALVISTIQILVVSLNYKIYYGGYTSPILLYLNYITRVPSFGLPYEWFIVIFVITSLIPIFGLTSIFIFSEWTNHRRILFQILSTFLYLFAHILYIPIFSVSLAFLNCRSESDTLFLFSNTKCYNFPNTLFLSFSIIIILLTIFITMNYFIFVFERFNFEFHRGPDNRFFIALVIYKTVLVLMVDLMPQYQIITASVGIIGTLTMIIITLHFMPFYNILTNVLYISIFSFNLASFLSGFFAESHPHAIFSKEYFLLIISTAPIFILFFTLCFIIRRELFKLYLCDMSVHDERKEGTYPFHLEASLVDVLVHMTNSKDLQKKIYEIRLKNDYSLRTIVFYSLYLIYESDLNEFDRLKLFQLTQINFISSFLFFDTMYLNSFCEKKRLEINLNSEVSNAQTMIELKTIHKYQSEMMKWLNTLWKRHLLNIANFDIFPSIVATLQYYERLSDESFSKLLSEDGDNPVVLRNYSSFLYHIKRDPEQSMLYRDLANKQEEKLKNEGRNNMFSKSIEEESNSGKISPRMEKIEERISVEEGKYHEYLQRITNHRLFAPILLFIFLLLLSIFSLTVIASSFANTTILSRNYDNISHEIQRTAEISRFMVDAAICLRTVQVGLLYGKFNTTYHWEFMKHKFPIMQQELIAVYEESKNEVFVDELWKSSEVVEIYFSETNTFKKMSLFDGTRQYFSFLNSSLQYLDENGATNFQDFISFRNLLLNSRYSVLDGFQLMIDTLLNARVHYENKFWIFSFSLIICSFSPPVSFLLVYLYIRGEQIKVFKLMMNIPKSAISNVFKLYSQKNDNVDEFGEEDRENLILANLTSEGNISETKLPIMKKLIPRFIAFQLFFVILTIFFIIIGFVIQSRFQEDSIFLKYSQKRTFLIDRLLYNGIEKALFKNSPPLNISSLKTINDHIYVDMIELVETNNVVRFGSRELGILGTDGLYPELTELHYGRTCGDIDTLSCISFSELILQYFNVCYALLLDNNATFESEKFTKMNIIASEYLDSQSKKVSTKYLEINLEMKLGYSNIIDSVFSASVIFFIAFFLILFSNVPTQLREEMIKAKKLFLYFPTNILDTNQILSEFLNKKTINFRKQKEISINESNEKFDMILRTTFDAVLELNEKFIIQTSNQSATQMFHLQNNPGELLGKNLLDLLDDKAIELISSHFILKGDTYTKIKPFNETVILNVNNQSYHVEMTITLGNSFIVLIEDISDIKNQMNLLEFEQNRLLNLLEDTLPQDIADKIFERETNLIMNNFEKCSILHANIIGFTKLLSQVSTEDGIKSLNKLFDIFDQSCAKYKVEKIKTMEDCYIVASKEVSIIEFGKFMLKSVESFNKNSLFLKDIKLRIGIDTGKCVHGIVGKKKYSFEVMSNSFNFSSLLESTGIPSKIHVSEATFDLMKDHYKFNEFEEIENKNGNKTKTYILQEE
eukprot:gene9049-1146_t